MCPLSSRGGGGGVFVVGALKKKNFFCGFPMGKKFYGKGWTLHAPAKTTYIFCNACRHLVDFMVLLLDGSSMARAQTKT